jgi:methionyl-tRNA synthetase
MIIEKPDDAFKGFEALNLKVGEVLSVRPHPNAEKLLVLEVDIGKKIQLVAGLRAYYPNEQLKGKKIVVVSNMQPAKLRGMESQGMLLAAESGGNVRVLTPARDAAPGDLVNSGRPQAEREISFSDFQKVMMKVGAIIDEARVDIGREVTVKLPLKTPGLKVAVFLPTPEAKEALPLYTSTGVPITVDGGEIENGATVR